jgi:hypothetical protein
LRQAAARFRDYAETASDWLWEIGPDYKFTLLTENAFGSDPADRIGTACWDHALDLETEPWRLVFATLDSRKPFRDFVYCSVDGRGAPLYVKASGKQGRPGNQSSDFVTNARVRATITSLRVSAMTFSCRPNWPKICR